MSAVLLSMGESIDECSIIRIFQWVSNASFNRN